MNNIRKNNNDGSIVQSVDRALQILCAFDNKNPEMSIHQLCQIIDLPKSTVHRLLTTLAYRGFIEQLPDTKKYRLGLKLRELDASVVHTRTINSEAEPILKRLISQCGETVSISVLDGIETMIVEKIESSHAMRVTSQIGKRNPIHCSGSGKVLLAFQNMNLSRQIIEKAPFTRFNDKTITDPQKFVETLMEVRKNCYALDDEEIVDDQICIAAPVWDNEDKVFAAITASGPATRIRGKGISFVVSCVMEAADDLSKALGWLGNKQDYLKNLILSEKADI